MNNSQSILTPVVYLIAAMLCSFSNSLAAAQTGFNLDQVENLINRVKKESSSRTKEIGLKTLRDEFSEKFGQEPEPIQQSSPSLVNSNLAKLNPSILEGVEARLYLIVSGNPRPHLADALQQLFMLNKTKKVAIGTIYVVEQSNSSIDTYGFISVPEVEQVMIAAPTGADGLWNFSLQQIDKTPESLHLERSPAWLIESVKEKMFYLYEGFNTVAKNFSSDGKFIEYRSRNLDPEQEISNFGRLVARYQGNMRVSFLANRAGEMYSGVQSKITKETLKDIIKSSTVATRKKILSEISGSGEENNDYLEIASLPPCRETNVRRTPVANQLSLQSQLVNYIYYDPQDNLQVAKASIYPQQTRVPYISGPFIDDTDPRSKKELSDPRLILAMLFAVSCLPSKVHFVSDDKLAYLEIREGEDAWEK